MKIEIEFEEVEFLKKDNERLKIENEDMRKHLKNMHESQLIKNSISVAHELFKTFMNCTFEKIGFNGNNQDELYRNRFIEFNQYDVEHYLKNCATYESYKPLITDFQISARLSEAWKTAFIKIGIDFNKLTKEVVK